MGCVPACWAMPECGTCGMRKKPRGRDAGAAAANGYCGYDCLGYFEPPVAGHLWPGEEAPPMPTPPTKPTKETP